MLYTCNFVWYPKKWFLSTHIRQTCISGTCILFLNTRIWTYMTLQLELLDPCYQFFSAGSQINDSVSCNDLPNGIYRHSFSIIFTRYVRKPSMSFPPSCFCSGSSSNISSLPSSVCQWHFPNTFQFLQAGVSLQNPVLSGLWPWLIPYTYIIFNSGYCGVCLINTVCWKLALFLSQDYADTCCWHYGFLSYDTVASVLRNILTPHSTLKIRHYSSIMVVTTYEGVLS